MKATLEFNLPEEYDEHMNALQGLTWQMVLMNVDNKLREISKYGDDGDKADWAQEIRDYLYEEMNERGLQWSP